MKIKNVKMLKELIVMNQTEQRLLVEMKETVHHGSLKD